MTTAIFKCRKCRASLFDNKSVVSAHGIQLNFGALNEATEEATVWYIAEDNYPTWIKCLVDESNWVKGRLVCPKCASRLGSFDFTNGAKCKCCNLVLPSAHITKARVDCDIKSDNSQLLPTLSRNNSDRRPLQLPQLPSTSSSSRPIAQLNPNLKKEALESPSGYLISSNIPVKSTVGIQPAAARLSKRRSDLYKVISDTDNLTCPICLEIYYCPTVCHPCSHVFCDPCLRRLGKKKPTKTPCPMCRQIIHQCTPHKEFQKQILLQFSCQHSSRKAIERGLETQNLPLPWKPKYHLRWFSQRDYPTSTWRMFGWSFGSLFGVSTLHIRMSTLSLLLILLSVCAVTCAGGFFLMKYALWLFQVSPEKSHHIVSCACIVCLAASFRFLIEHLLGGRRTIQQNS